jgi:nitroreductase
MSDEPGLFEVMYNCRAMRRLKPDPIPDDVLVKLIDAGNQAPSGSNLQNARWLVVKDEAQKRKIAALNKAAVDAYLGGQRVNMPSLPHQDAERRKRMMDAVDWQAAHMAEAPALIVACLQMGGPPPNSFMAGAGSAGSVWPGVQNLLLAARGLGLGAAPTTLGLSNRAAFKEAVGLPDTIEPFVLIPVGYPKGKFGPVSRRPVSEIMRWDRWD